MQKAKEIFYLGRKPFFISTLMFLLWLLIGGNGLFFLSIFVFTYTLYFSFLILKAISFLKISSNLNHYILMQKDRGILELKFNDLKTPLMFSSKVKLPPYIVKEEILEENKEKKIKVMFKANRRGLFTLGDIFITVSDPFYLFKKTIFIKGDLKLFVFPRLLAIKKLSIYLQDPIDGKRVKYAPNYDTSNLAGVRPYEEGDPYSRIHWKIVAHRNEIFTKEFTPSSSKNVLLVLNLALRKKPIFNVDSFEDHATSATASILKYCYDNHLNFSLSIFGKNLVETPFLKSSLHFYSLVKNLSYAKAIKSYEEKLKEENSFLSYIRNLKFKIPYGAELVLIQNEIKKEEIIELLKLKGVLSHLTIIILPQGYFLFPEENPVPFFLQDFSEIRELKRSQKILRAEGVNLHIIGINDPLNYIERV